MGGMGGKDDGGGGGEKGRGSPLPLHKLQHE